MSGTTILHKIRARKKIPHDIVVDENSPRDIAEHNDPAGDFASDDDCNLPGKIRHLVTVEVSSHLTPVIVKMQIKHYVKERE